MSERHAADERNPEYYVYVDTIYVRTLRSLRSVCVCDGDVCVCVWCVCGVCLQRSSENARLERKHKTQNTLEKTHTLLV